MKSAASNSKPRPWPASGFALVTAVGYASVPVSVQLAGDGTEPFAFVAVYVAITGPLSSAYAVRCRNRFGQDLVRVVVELGRCVCRGPGGVLTAAIVVFGPAALALNVLAVQLVGVVTVVVSQAWPLAAALLLRTSTGEAARRLAGGTAVLMVAAAGAAGAALAKQITALPAGGWTQWVVGVMAASASTAIGAAIVSETIRVAYGVHQAASGVAGGVPAGSTMCAPLVVTCVTGVVVSAVAAVVTGGFSSQPRWVLAATAEGVLNGTGAVALRRAHQHSSGLGVLALSGTDPVFAIVGMGLLGAQILRPGWFAVAVGVLIATNVAIRPASPVSSKRPGDLLAWRRWAVKIAPGG